MSYLITGSEYIKKFPNFALIGMEDEMERMFSILTRKKANSVLLVGPGGVGCSTLCIGLEYAKKDPSAPFDIISKRLYWFDYTTLFATGDMEYINSEFAKIVNVLKRTPNSVLIVENTKDFIENARANGASHFINALISMVKEDTTQVIFEVREENLEYVLSYHGNIRESFTMLLVDEPKNGELEKIVDNIAIRISEYYKIAIDDDAKRAAIEMTSKYRVNDPGLSRAQPERTTTLLDRAMSSYALEAHKNIDPETKQRMNVLYREQRDAELEIHKLDDKIAEILASKEPSTYQFSEPAEVVRIRTDIRKLEEYVKENADKYHAIELDINASLKLDRAHVLREFAKISGISANKLGEDEKDKLRNLEEILKGRIFGQDHVVKKLANAVKVARVGNRNKDKPQASFMFLGPSGTGKTEIAKVLSLALLDSEKALTRFDMSEYMEKHSVSKLIGSPPGFEGFEMGGALTNAMRSNPNRILLFDEIEKAHPVIFDIFLQILSDGRLTDNVGRVVSFSDSIIIMTTNIGQPRFLDTSMTFEEASELAIADLGDTYRNEFLNRFAGRQNIVCFNALKAEHIAKIIRREFNDLISTYVENGINLSITDETINEFCEHHYDPATGARGLPGYIQANLEPIIAELVIEGKGGDLEVRVSTENKNLEVVYK